MPTASATARRNWSIPTSIAPAPRAASPVSSNASTAVRPLPPSIGRGVGSIRAASYSSAPGAVPSSCLNSSSDAFN